MKIAILIARILFGLVFFVFGLNGFFHFIPAPPPTGKAGDFVMALVGSGYLFQLLKLTEILCGLAIIAGVYLPLALVVLFPVTLNITLFHIFLAPEGMAMGIVLLLLHLFLAYAHRKYYTEILTMKTTL